MSKKLIDVRNIRKVKRGSDFSVTTVFSSCRAATVFEKSLVNETNPAEQQAIRDKRMAWEGEGFPPVGTICKYEYCRGGEFSGICQVRGYDGWEVWCKTLNGENHFGTSNFVVTVDCDFSPVSSPEEYEGL